MANDATAPVGHESQVLDRWSARRIQPVVVLYVLVVFAVFIAMAHFVFHSPDAVKALVVAAVGAVAATMPGVMSKVEYRATESGIEKRTLNEKKPAEFEEAFRWDRLSHVKRTGHGFKFYLTMDETSLPRRFWKTHISDECSGEIHAEEKDLDRVLAVVDRHGIRVS